MYIPIDDYLEEFFIDLVELRKDGYKYNEETFNVDLHFFACDAPVRVAVKCIVALDIMHVNDVI